MRSLLAELRRRNVIRMAGLYLVASWLATQVAGTLLPMFEAPLWIGRTVVIALAIGLIPTMIFSWVYELTPEGLKRDADVPLEQSIGGITGRRLDFAIIAVLLVALGYFAIDRFVFEPARIERARAEAAVPAHAAGQADRSIVVLPFADMSQAKDQEYFSDGLAEELLNLLARVPQLRVISRSSAFSFKGKALDIATIAKQLDVAHVLEGSVRKAGNAVRITVQLIDARNDAHIWSETYDRPLGNIFAIQDEIAAAVVSKLKITLLGDAPKAVVTDPAAYALYLEGRERFRTGSAEGYESAKHLFNQALAISPDYAQAWQALADVYLNQTSRGMYDVEEGTRLAREATNRALALAPDFALAAADMGWIANVHDRDLASAAHYLERAFALDPGNIYIVGAGALMARSLGRIDLAIALQRRTVQLDPAAPVPWAQLGKVYSFGGRQAEAIAAYRKALEVGPGFVGLRHWLGMVLLGDQGDHNKGEEVLALAAAEPNESYRLLTQAMAYHALGRNAESDAALDEASRKYEDDTSYNIAYVHVYRGEPDEAFAWLDKAFQHNDTGLTELILQPLFASVHDDPRWLPFLRKIGRAPEQLAKIEFKVTLPPEWQAEAATQTAAKSIATAH